MVEVAERRDRQLPVRGPLLGLLQSRGAGSGLGARPRDCAERHRVCESSPPLYG